MLFALHLFKVEGRGGDLHSHVDTGHVGRGIEEGDLQRRGDGAGHGACGDGLQLRLGGARIGGTEFRFKLYAYDGAADTPIAPEQAAEGLPVLFKPMGAPRPKSSYIACDADYVDYITELMGG